MKTLKSSRDKPVWKPHRIQEKEPNESNCWRRSVYSIWWPLWRHNCDACFCKCLLIVPSFRLSIRCAR